MATDKMKQLIEKRDAVNARIRREQNKLRSDERRKDTRRKILAGAAVLEWAARDSEFDAKLTHELGRFLVRETDRELFALPPAGGREGTAPRKPPKGAHAARDLAPEVPRLEEA